jgi:hypothetical protein
VDNNCGRGSFCASKEQQAGETWKTVFLIPSLFFILFNLVIFDEPNVDSNPKALNTV